MFHTVSINNTELIEMVSNLYIFITRHSTPQRVQHLYLIGHVTLYTSFETQSTHNCTSDPCSRNIQTLYGTSPVISLLWRFKFSAKETK